jgi:gamma-glutamyl-gamma-aminobutyrate hydrolase PuuD
MKSIHEAVSKLLTVKLDKHKNEKLNAATCTAIYQDVFDTFVGIFQESKITISNEAMNLVSQLYYDSISINGGQELDPNIFEKRASTKNVETKELAMLATMFSGTPFASIFIYEIKRR